MPNNHSTPTIAFVWRPQAISAGLAEMARRTGTRAVFDLSGTEFTSFSETLRAARATDVKLAFEQFMDDRLTEFMKNSGTATVWVEYHRGFTMDDGESFLERLQTLNSDFCCVPVTGDLNFVKRLLEKGDSRLTLALKGSEASGFVSAETTGILFSIIEDWLRDSKDRPQVIIWGGVAMPEAAAAFLTSGAAGIVFESLHWLTSLVKLDPDLSRRLVSLRPDSTTLTGLRLGTPGRFFNRGNSLAISDLNGSAASKPETGGTDQERYEFVQKIKKMSVPALESDLNRDQLIPLSPEAAFAGCFAKNFGQDTEKAINEFLEATAGICAEASRTWDSFRNGPLVREMGLNFPIIQGAMSWITDRPSFALAVAEAGGLPTLALGLRNTRQIKKDLGDVPKTLKGHPYAVNIITLAENPFRDEQLAWIEKTRPPFAVIAAGEPAHAARLLKQGIEVIYLAADEGLLRMALKAGVRYLVCEGSEAGGHIGAHSTLTMAQIVLQVKKTEPELFRDRHIILAGGIHNRETAFRAAILGADAVQMGTAYLAAKEIVSTGALTRLYQDMILSSTPGQTLVTGESVGLRVRALQTPKSVAIRGVEDELRAGREPEAAVRSRLEEISAGSLHVAARGARRPGEKPLDEETCRVEGQFLSGAVAGVIGRTRTVAELHRETAGEGFQPVIPNWEKPGPAAPRSSLSRAGRPERIAITGMALINALGHDPLEIWRASLALKSGITSVPASRWDHSLFFDPIPGTPEKTYCQVGAFQDIEITRKDLGIPPQDFRTMSDSTKLTLWLAKRAIADSGLLQSDIPRERIGVLVSQNSGETGSTMADLVIRFETRNIINSVRNIISLTPPQEAALDKAIKADRIVVDDTTLLGRINCAAGGFICNQYGFMGPSYSVSAACATGLVAIYSAVQMIRNGVLDAAIVGGGEEFLHPATFLEFSALGALAGLTGQDRIPSEWSRPFNADRDGMVLGEGGGMIVIERESLAEKRGARIHAFITGLGASNNNRGMVESLAATQRIAIESSFKDAAIGPDQIDFIECHATSTVQGDVEEIKALKSLYPNGSTTVLSSFKSQIGHTLGVSGLNSLIRGVCALQAGIFPATLNYRKPDPDINLEAWGFHVPVQPEDWPRPGHRDRRLQVNAFGFGGANYVLQIEECRQSSGLILPPISTSTASNTSSGGGGAPPDLGVSFFRTELNGQAHRLAVIAENAREARQKALSRIPWPETGALPPSQARSIGREGVFIEPERQPLSPPMSFVFAGQGTYYQGMGRELYGAFEGIKRWMDRLAAVADFDLLDLMFNSREDDLRKTRWQQPALFTLELAVAHQLRSLGLKPTAMAGHSLGELTALCLAGVFSPEDGFRLVNKRAQCMDKASSLALDPGAMIAVDAPKALLEAKVAEGENLYFTNYNSPRQVVIGGGTVEITALKETLDAAGYWTARLKVSMAFHSPIMKVIHDELEEFIAGIEFFPPRIPVISNTTQQRFPDDAAQMKRIVMAHLETPVHWMQNVQTLWNDFGVRVFVEIGPRDTLCNLIGDTLEQAQCLPTCHPDGEVQTFRAAAARLYTLGQIKPDPVPDMITPPNQAGAVSSRPVVSEEKIMAVAQREINAFAFNGVEKYLKPAILEAVRREADPSFTEDRLQKILGQAALQPVSFPARPIAAPPSKAVPKTGPAPRGDYLEQVIGIIMDATGYERNEIEGDMDIRQDLAIRSSRLPVIMDAAERAFGIEIRLEDFIEVRTVRDMAERIEEVVKGQGGSKSPRLSPDNKPLAPEVKTPPAPGTARGPLKRLVFKEASLPLFEGPPLALARGDLAAVISLGGSGLADRIADSLRCGSGLQIKQFTLPLADNSGQRSALNTAETILRDLPADGSLTGLVIALDSSSILSFADPKTGSGLLTACFLLLKSLLNSRNKKFALFAQSRPDLPDDGSIVAEAVQGMFLAASHEYASVVFRRLVLDAGVDLNQVLALAMSPGGRVVEMTARSGGFYTTQAEPRPIAFTREPKVDFSPDQVVVVSGGGRGITSYLARALAPFGCKLALLGRTALDPGVDYNRMLASRLPDDETVTSWLVKNDPGYKLGMQIELQQTLKRGLEITRTLNDLSRVGVEAAYYTSDVSDAGEAAAVVQQVKDRYGRVDGIIHGAGVIKDAFIGLIEAGEFEQVMDVKLSGLWNLYQAARNLDLKFMIGLSSIAAVQGNPGQANYCAANRAMAALIRIIGRKHPGLKTKTLWLPPIEGAGMADDPEIRELLKLRSMDQAYVRVDELAEFFSRELVLALDEDDWVIPARNLPQTKTSLLTMEGRGRDNHRLEAAGVVYKREDFPMIDSIDRVDLADGLMETTRTISWQKDLWLPDHKPFDLLKHPVFSGIMAMESFLENSALLYPQFVPQGVREVKFFDLLDCPPDTERETRNISRRSESADGAIICSSDLLARELSPAGRPLDRWSKYFAGQVILGGPRRPLTPWPEFAIHPDELDTRPMPPDEVTEKYRSRTSLLGRYRVLESLDGTGPDLIRGHMVYRESTDFDKWDQVCYHYPRYLFEALMHIMTFYVVMRDEKEERKMVPFGFEEMRFTRPGRAGERFILEARLRHQDASGFVWDGQGADSAGRPVMQVKGMNIRWYGPYESPL